MAEHVKVKGLPKDFKVACTSDWHCGAKAFHEDALDRLIAWLKESPRHYMGFGGDSIEGKRIDSPHFDPDALRPGEHSIEKQLRWVRAKLAPVADRILWWGLGNHDIYVSRDIDPVRTVLVEPLGLLERMGGYQTWVDLGHFRVHVYHGRASMPRGAKDPIQSEANQKAWLVNRLSPLAGDCALHLMGHVHALLVQPPLDRYALLVGEDGVRARYFREPTSSVLTRDHAGRADTRSYIPPGSRWYGCTGTLRRSGGFGYLDYSEVAGYPPAPIGWLELTVKGGQVAGLDKVVV